MKPLLVFLFAALIGIDHSYAQTNLGLSDTTVIGSVDNYPNGKTAFEKLIQEKGTYPSIALQNNVTGIVSISFIIEKDGSLSHVNSVSGIGSGSDEEAMRLIKLSGKWQPSKIDGISVKTRCLVQFRFSIKKNANNLDFGVFTVEPNNLASKRISDFIKAQSFGMPISEVPDYMGKSVHFFGKIINYQKISDTLLVIICNDLDFSYNKLKVGVVLHGSEAELDKLKIVAGNRIKGFGKVGLDGGATFIIIDDKKNCIIENSPNFY